LPVAEFNVSSDFGIRKHPLTGKSHFHTGLDLMSQTGDDKVFAVKPGIVVMAEYHLQYGNTVVIRHLNGVESLYAHMAQLAVKLGDKVTTESLLGYIGNTGESSTGKHLHFEILVGGRALLLATDLAGTSSAKLAAIAPKWIETMRLRVENLLATGEYDPRIGR
jgi:murein DD-endopeptidase MepM/ murein hydrolase activator NlpD